MITACGTVSGAMLSTRSGVSMPCCEERSLHNPVISDMNEKDCQDMRALIGELSISTVGFDGGNS